MVIICNVLVAANIYSFGDVIKNHQNDKSKPQKSIQRLPVLQFLQLGYKDKNSDGNNIVSEQNDDRVHEKTCLTLGCLAWLNNR